MTTKHRMNAETCAARSEEGLQRGRRFLCLTVCLLSIQQALVLKCVAQQPLQSGGFATATEEWQFGFQLFHLLLEQNGLKAIREIPNRTTQRPDQTVVVVVGELRRISQSKWTALCSFALNGGALLIASDERGSGADLFRFDGGPVEVTDERLAYQGYADCPVISQFDEQHPLMQGVGELVANRAGWIDELRPRFGRWRIVATLPREASTRDGRGASMPLIATADDVGRSGEGRIVEIADHSLLINGMLWHGDNALFAMNLADWLSEGDRRQLLFLVDGTPIQDLLPPASPQWPNDLPPEMPTDLPEIPPEAIPPLTLEDLANLPPDTLLSFANNFITGLEDADVHNELVAGPAETTDGLFRQRLLLTLAILAGLFLLRQSLRGGSGRLERSTSRAMLSGTAARVQELVQSRDLRLASRELARDLFRQLTGSESPDDWKIRPVEVQVSAGPLKRRWVRNAMQSLKTIATESGQVRVTPREFKVIARQVEQLHQLNREGRLSHPWFAAQRSDAMAVRSAHLK